ncbi:MAG: hypothetical protein ACP5VE_03055 [Chthonomonadales bacterium]
MHRYTGQKAVFIAARLLAGLILTALPCRADLTVDAFIGFDRFVRAGSWSPALITVKGTGVTTQAQCQLLFPASEPNSGTTTFMRSVDLHAGVLNERVPLAYFADEDARLDEARVRLVAQGHVLADQKLPAVQTLSPFQPLIVALTRDRSGLGYLHRADLGLPHQPSTALLSVQFTTRGTGSRQQYPCAVAYPEPFTLPTCPEAYSAADCVFLGDIPLDALSDAQWSALIQWVRDGGAIVISGVPDISRLRDPKIAGLLPMMPQGTRQLPSLAALAARYRAPSLSSPVAVVTGTLGPDAVVVCTQGAVPLVVARREGRGTVIFTTFDLASRQISAWPGAPALWRELLRLRQAELSASAIVEAQLHRGLNSFAMGSFEPQGALRMLGDALAGDQAASAPGVGFVGLYLAAYILCLVPLNYMILRRKDRREWAWVTAPLVVVAFSVGAYGVGYALRGSSLRLSYATILEGAAGQRSLRALTLATIFSPASTKYDLATADTQAVARGASFAPFGFGIQAQDVAVDEGPGHGVRDVRVRMWSVRSFELVGHADLGGEIDAAFIPGIRAGTVRVTNNTAHRLVDCAVTYRASAVFLGTMEPYSTKLASLRVAPAEPWGRIAIAAPSVMGASPQYSGSYPRGTSSLQEDRIRQALAVAISSNPAQLEGSDPLLFTGWLDEPVIGLTIKPGPGIQHGTTLVAIHVPLPTLRSGADPQIGLPPHSRRDPFAPAPLRRIKKPLRNSSGRPRPGGSR